MVSQTLNQTFQKKPKRLSKNKKEYIIYIYLHVTLQ